MDNITAFVEEFFVCSCCAEAINLGRFVDDPTHGIYVGLWERMPNDWDWGYRIKLAFQVLLRGNTPGNEIILEPQVAKKLGQRLMELANNGK